MTGQIDLPEPVDPGPTKPEIRAIVLQKLRPEPTDHFVDVGAGSGAMSIAAGRLVDRVTAIERDPERIDAIRSNLRSNDVDSTVEVREAEAPAGLPEAADAVFVGGTRGFESVLDRLPPMGVKRVVLNAARLQTAATAVEAFRARGLLDEVLSLGIQRGFDLGGETGFRAENPVFVIVGSVDRRTDESGGGGRQ